VSDHFVLMNAEDVCTSRRILTYLSPYVGPLHQPYHRHIPSAAELQRMASEGGWEVVEFRKGSNTDTRVPFINTAFLWRFSKSGGGFIDVAFDP
jgi:hypothetical protein